jgi:antitoxin HicB
MKKSKMQKLVYFARFEPGEEGSVVVSFPDVPEATTKADSEAYGIVQAQAQEALGRALLSYPMRGRAVPVAKAKGRGLVPIVVDPIVFGKIAVLDGFRASGITKSELGRRLGRDEMEIRDILDPRHRTKLSTLAEALLWLSR